MKLLKNILLATDFGKSSEYVLENAMSMAKKFDSTITPIFVLPENIENNKAKGMLKDFALDQLNLTTSKIKAAGIETSEAILDHGIFSKRIVNAAEKINANMIIIGAGEKSEGDSFILGSNAKKIIKKSSKPVFVIKSKSNLAIHTICCPIDFSLESKRALKNAITLAHRFKAKLIVLSVYDAPEFYSLSHRIDVTEEIASIRNVHEREFNEFISPFNFDGIDVSLEIVQGEPAEQIIIEAKKHKADLVVIGTTGKSGISKILMGSVAEKVIRNIPNSFITLKQEDLIVLELESKIRSIEEHSKLGQQLYKDGFFKESINEFKSCLDVNFMHLPSLQGLASAYTSLGDTENAEKFNTMASQVLAKNEREKQ